MTTILLILTGAAFGVLQSVLFADIMPMGIVPDIALILLLAASCHYGSMTGTIAGFFIGLTFDVMGLAPLGFHAFIFTLSGYLFGLLRSSIALGRFLLPILLILAATALKYGAAYLLDLVFNLGSIAMRYFLWDTLVEAGANSLLAPLIFWLFQLVRSLAEKRRGGFR